MSKVQTTIYQGDCRKLIRKLPDNSVDCIITSPPYFALRDYEHEGQIGLEATDKAYVRELDDFFFSCMRVLKSSGTLWLNIGDRYATMAGRSSIHNVNSKKNTEAIGGFKRPKSGDDLKQRLMIPARVALRMQKSGWILRDEVIWHKTMVMPVPLKDRTTPAHEMVYMFSKSKTYYYDIDATKEISRQINTIREKKSGFISNTTEIKKERALMQKRLPGSVVDQRQRINPSEKTNLRSVWSIAPYSNPKNEHYAAFPPALVEPMILGGCPRGGTVLDPFGGIGTTGLVANQLGCNAILFELNPKNVQTAKKRLTVPGFMIAKPMVRV